jgi:hypothetical protein
MNAKLVCKECGAYCWVPYYDDPDVGGGECNLDNAEWKKEDCEEEDYDWDDPETCDHDEYDIVDTEWVHDYD